MPSRTMVPAASALRFFGHTAARHSGVSLCSGAAALASHPWRKIIVIVSGRLGGGFRVGGSTVCRSGWKLWRQNKRGVLRQFYFEGLSRQLRDPRPLAIRCGRCFRRGAVQGLGRLERYQNSLCGWTDKHRRRGPFVLRNANSDCCRAFSYRRLTTELVYAPRNSEDNDHR
jgi:hypothetical protein